MNFSKTAPKNKNGQLKRVGRFCFAPYLSLPTAQRNGVEAAQMLRAPRHRLLDVAPHLGCFVARVADIGWGDIGDVAAYESKSDIKSALAAHYPLPIRNNFKSGSESLWSFCHDVRIGDLIILSGDKSRELVVKVVGDYEFVAGDSPLYGEYNHQRAIEIAQYDGEKLWRAAGGLEAGVSVYRTLVRCQNAVDGDTLPSLTA